ncbi:MAG: hypothetical protein V3S33_02490 [Gammaproteobacteria bacterium]
MILFEKSEWRVPAGLMALSFVPIAAGIFRLVQLGGGAEITPENIRFFAAPLPVVLHVITVTLYCVLGAFQFVPRVFAAATPGGTVLPGGL